MQMTSASANGFYQQHGNAVSSVIINDRYLILGGQSIEVFEQTLRRIAAGSQQVG